jgi:hypothetical protein
LLNSNEKLGAASVPDFVTFTAGVPVPLSTVALAEITGVIPS